MTDLMDNFHTVPEAIAPDGLQRVPPVQGYVPSSLVEMPLYMEEIPQYKRGVIYIAGPMRGYPNFNFPAFYEAELKLQSRGWLVGNPARMDDEDKIEYSVMPGNTGVRAAMERDLVWIAKNATAMYMLVGWEASEGANAEWALAKTLHLPIYYEATL